MKAIFDRNCKCVGWQDENSEMVFNDDMQWLGFVRDGNFFSCNSTWLGGFCNGSFNDRRGRPVAWVDGSPPQGTTPPLRPLRPLRPLTPLGGWSHLSWESYINQHR